MTQIVSNSAVKQQTAMTLLMAPSQPSHILEKQIAAELGLRTGIGIPDKLFLGLLTLTSPPLVSQAALRT
ncbi:hypothetical protein E2C01_036847 [Portunus trituberculatus]|uniref:Uncharacterized protein n=1 Tax=Portunus trituberculatus TaxID=210409 RepID=A0A5B7FCB8_PORTR|nr:hypothetical protein [Portunus trituberculatus]